MTPVRLHFPGLPGAAKRAYGRLPFGAGLVFALATAAALVERVIGPLPAWLETPVVQIQGISGAFLGIFLESLPFLLLGSLASGMLAAFGGNLPLAGWLARRPLFAAAAGGLMGLFLPVGEVGAIPLARRLLDRGAPVSLAAALLLAAPALNPVTAASTLAAFGLGRIFWGRMILSFAIAVFAGWVIARCWNSRSMYSAWPLAEAFRATNHTQTWQERARNGLIQASDTFFELGSLLAVGALLAAAVRAVVFAPGLEPAGFSAWGQGTVTSVVAAMGFAGLLSTGSATDAFSAVLYGAQPGGALLAFLVFGPVVDIKNALLYGKIFGLRMALLLVLLPAALALLAGVLLQGFWMGG